ncbi:hypothetical protein BH10ACT11_BH10ACT11_09210 [soil metagenome]
MARHVKKARERLSNFGSLISAAAGISGKLAACRLIWFNQVSSATKIVRVPMKGLNGESLFVRSGSSDLYNATWYYRDEIQLPPPGLREEPLSVICEIGTNMGAALTALGLRYPHARLIGVEPDAENVEMARMNTARFGDRCEIVHAGVGAERGRLAVDRTSEFGSHGFTLRPVTEADRDDSEFVDVLPLEEILGSRLGQQPVDYLHVSIEGAEPFLFEGDSAWARQVRSLKMELHPYYDFTAADCLPELTRLGFRAWVDPEIPDKWVFAVKDGV